MRLTAIAISVLVLVGHTSVARGTDACSTTAIQTAADVTVSDGSAFKTESYFHSKEAAAIRHLSDSDQVIAVEGPLSWVAVGEAADPGSNFHKLFALGHQYHALLLHFDEIVSAPRTTTQIRFADNNYRARSGDYPYGGAVHLIESAEPSRPVGLLFEFPEAGAIEVTFSDWRQAGDVELPYLASIDDGERVFDYRYTRIETAAASPLWFYQAVSAPRLEQVQVYRLHRKLLAAHCLGDASLMAELSADPIVSVNNGEISRASGESMRERFTSVFENVNYSAYHDIQPPMIEIAESADIGWIAVNVRAIGSEIASGESFDTQWAWLMTVRKVDGQWLHAGNASNVAR